MALHMAGLLWSHFVETETSHSEHTVEYRYMYVHTPLYGQKDTCVHLLYMYMHAFHTEWYMYMYVTALYGHSSASLSLSLSSLPLSLPFFASPSPSLFHFFSFLSSLLLPFSLSRLNYTALASTHPTVFHLFVYSIFIHTHLNSPLLLLRPPSHAFRRPSQLHRLELCDRLLLTLRAGGVAEGVADDPSLYLKAVVMCYGLLCPMLQRHISTPDIMKVCHSLYLVAHCVTMIMNRLLLYLYVYIYMYSRLLMDNPPSHTHHTHTPLSVSLFLSLFLFFSLFPPFLPSFPLSHLSFSLSLSFSLPPFLLPSLLPSLPPFLPPSFLLFLHSNRFYYTATVLWQRCLDTFSPFLTRPHSQLSTTCWPLLPSISGRSVTIL